ncbi:N-acetylmannosamine-6-phosphate 2-epimerase [Spirulina subsalsa FACHB-351]|uniref:Putative N-acetylmannosamine-6-phosphate 2-epimerase n=1 Tax=Spirulina subsalsa FACHB-351 TaxID=234711 RepID=A0ABT3L5D9_9CYAN|nr:N-acetylmannosamine-6-phosphate 2-epimerase [Spirulina subsalsa]MCW6036721.1 N-acetylmannosamine-6-phosphate 2-epimerase [Spirulina subsalsa FACHB-351]
MLDTLKHKLIVSCQAPVDSPLHSPIVITALAKAAILRGAVGVRIDTPSHVKAVREQLPTVPIIGLWKQQIPGYSVYITPRFEDAIAIGEAGADIIAIDATSRLRPNSEKVLDLISKIHQDLGKLVMADVDDLESARMAIEAGVDIVGTTLYGYTEKTQDCDPPGWDLLQQMVKEFEIPVICEGGIATPEMAKKALDLGAYSVVVGGAITGVDLKLQAFQAVFSEGN